MTREAPATEIDRELIMRTRAIDGTTTKLLPLLELLAETEGPSPLEDLRETLIQLLLEQRQTTERLARIEQHLRSSRATNAPSGGGNASRS